MDVVRNFEIIPLQTGDKIAMIKFPQYRRALFIVFHKQLIFADAPVTHISLLGNRMTCHVEGNPRPSLSWVLPNGNILANMSSVYLGRAERGNGRYSCRGSSPIKPDSIDTLDVQRAEDLREL